MVDRIERWSYPSLRACCRTCECLYLEGTLCAAKSGVSSATASLRGHQAFFHVCPTVLTHQATCVAENLKYFAGKYVNLHIEFTNRIRFGALSIAPKEKQLSPPGDGWIKTDKEKIEKNGFDSAIVPES